MIDILCLKIRTKRVFAKIQLQLHATLVKRLSEYSIVRRQALSIINDGDMSINQ